ncbi:saccharopine dehydrogenase family protein [Natrialbaceae archaeon GCM10025810]|uniref:saccharopine dehydrogenase family protein n=1 Tax=Halovalidus salilacus TaxID=3075124 RepID=UPI003608DA9E
MDTLLIYGSYGYTGTLVVREAVARGGSPVVAGRNGRRVAEQADRLGVEGRTFDLESPVLAERVGEFDAVLNCAGPFVNTADPLVEACLETGTDYLDLTGEFQVFERLRLLADRARDEGVTLLPGVGFDVVPSDCLAAALARTLPSANELTLGIRGAPSVSRGTARTLLSILETGGAIRRNGRLIRVPIGHRSREIDFGDGPQRAVTVPWGDIVTAAHSTDVDTVEVYAAIPDSVPGWATRALSTAGSVGRFVGRGPVKSAVNRLVDARREGPDGTELATGSAAVWGEVSDGDRTVSGLMRTPNPYALTAESAVSAGERVLEGDAPAGFQTPATALGVDFALELSGTERELLDAVEEPKGSRTTLDVRS